jgi:methionyl-tRNA formyltransferase
VTGGRAGDSRVRTVFLGSGGFGRESLRRLDDHDAVRLVGVVTAPPRPAGRRQRAATSVIAGVAHELGVRVVLVPERLRAPDSIAAILAQEPELLVLADYGQIVPSPLLELRYGALNLHPSLLPRHRGAIPIPAAILAGDTESGVTLMRMDAGLDTGPIIAQERVALDGTETTPRLEEALEMVASHLLDRSLGPWIRGEIKARSQPATGVTVTRPLTREDGRLDASRPAVELERRVRAYLPWPGTFLEWNGERLVVSAALVVPSEPGDVPGRLVRHGDVPAFTTIDGRLVLEAVTPPGRRAMSGADYLRGRRDLPA